MILIVIEKCNVEESGTSCHSFRLVIFIKNGCNILKHYIR